MYRIEVAPGEETVFRTIEELAVGIRNGVITSRSRVYHNASQKWLPIGLHPHYKKAMELPAASAAQPPAPTPPPSGPRIKPRPEQAAEPPRAAKVPVARAPAAAIPPPVTSPVVAMQQEVLRDLPVVAIPEPLPWTRPAAEPAARISAPAAVTRTPPPAPQAVQAQPPATVTYAPRATVAPPPLPAAVEHHLEEAREARPTARRAPRAGGRPFLLLGAAAFLVVAAHFALTATRSAPPDTGAEPTDAAPEAASELPSDEEIDADDAIDAAEPAPRVSSAPARVPMTPGPAFAGSVPVRPGADAAAPKATAPLPISAGSLAPGATAAAATPAIAPPPVGLDLELPAIAADSLVPKRRGDTMAMKKILRALNGAAPAEPSAAP